MSYSFGVRAADKAAAKAAVETKFDEVVLSCQPMHTRDRAAILANVSTVIDLLGDDDTKDVAVSCNGYISWGGTGEVSAEASPLSTVSISCTANHTPRLQDPGQ